MRSLQFIKIFLQFSEDRLYTSLRVDKNKFLLLLIQLNNLHSLLLESHEPFLDDLDAIIRSATGLTSLEQSFL